MKIKTSIEFLGIPKGSIGVVLNEESINESKHFSSIKVKFDCKEEPVLVGFPTDNLYTVERDA